MKSSPDRGQRRTSAHPEADSIWRTRELLEQAQSLVARATHEAVLHAREFEQRTRALEASAREMEELLARTERQAAQLANLYVATYQLHASLEVHDVRAAVADIAVNLLGAEEFSIWVRDDEGRLKRAPESTHGPSGEDENYGGGDALIDVSIAENTPRFGPAPASEALAVVPFAAHGKNVGVLVVQRFFAHKQGLSAEDRELLDLMAAHAASALLAAQAFHVTQRKLQAYEGLLGFMRKGAP